MLVQHQRQFFLNLLIFLVTSTSKSTIELLSLFLSFSHPRIAKVWRAFTPRAIPTSQEQLDTAAKALRTTGTLEETVSNSFNNNHNKTLVCNNANHSGSHHNRNRNNSSITYTNNTLISIMGITYEVIEIETSGKYIKIAESEKES